VKRRGRRPRVVHQHSAGGLVVRGGEVLLISTAGGARWQLPKGRLEAGESPRDAAVREVGEETGVTGHVVAPLPGIDYWFAEGAHKRIRKHVDYFLLDYVAGSEADFDPREVDAARWFAWDEALARLTHDNERRVVASARRLVEGEGPP
jgi:8-oxo-dGTP pyrophosphatase MutT (NUDIX family)